MLLKRVEHSEVVGAIWSRTVNLMSLDVYEEAKIEYDSDSDLFQGEILGLKGPADFFGKKTE